MRIHQTYNSKQWRDRAGRFRTLAITMRGTTAAILMADLADDYDKIAEKNERPATKAGTGPFRSLSGLRVR
jgi:hypothetical protein